MLTSVADTATGEVQAGSPVPEPGTLGMIVTGLLGVSGFPAAESVAGMRFCKQFELCSNEPTLAR
jgi:hypothetical protein